MTKIFFVNEYPLLHFWGIDEGGMYLDAILYNESFTISFKTMISVENYKYILKQIIINLTKILVILMKEFF